MHIISVVVVALTAVSCWTHTPLVGFQQEALTVCALVAQPAQYASKTVTVRAILVSGLEFEILEDNSCPPALNPSTGKHDLVEATFDRSQYDFNSKFHKQLARILKNKHQAEVTVTGLFTDPGHYVGHQNCCRYQFNIQRLISVQDIAKHP